MKNASLIALILAGSLTTANAADMAVKAPAAAPPVFGWTGFYEGLGVSGGYGWGNDSASLTGDVARGAGSTVVNAINNGAVTIAPDLTTAASRVKESGGTVGWQGGYNWQFDPKWLAGFETDIQWADIKGFTSFGVPSGSFSATSSERLQWYGTARARVGFIPLPQLLLYATGGLAYGETHGSGSVLRSTTFNLGLPSPGNPTSINCTGLQICLAGSDSKVTAGWTAGAGEEYAVTQHITLKVEYLHVDLGTHSFLLTPTIQPIGTGFITAQFKNAYDIVHAGFNYRF